MTAVVAALLCCCEDVPPDGCAGCDPVTITWTGDCTYEGACCPVDLGGATTAFNCASWTCANGIKTSPAFTDLCASLATKTTPFTAPSVGGSCGADNCNFDPGTAAGARLRFRLIRDEPNTQWVILVEGSGDVPSLCPNEIGGTGWSLRFVAPLSACPPAGNWFFDVAGSTMPIVGNPQCGEYPWSFDAGVTSFSVGTVTVGAA